MASLSTRVSVISHISRCKINRYEYELVILARREHFPRDTAYTCTVPFIPSQECLVKDIVRPTTINELIRGDWGN